MSIECDAIETKYVKWRNVELPHPQKVRKSPNFCLDGMAFYFESKGNWEAKRYDDLNGRNVYEEQWTFTTICLDNTKSFDYKVIPYVEETKGKYVRLGTTLADAFIWRSDFTAIFKSERDTVTMLFLFTSRSLNTDKVLIQSECLETVSIQPTSCQNSTKSPYSCKYCGKESVQTLCLKGLSEDIEKLFNDTASSDATLKCADKSFSVHRKVLAVRSEVFSAMFKHDMTERNCGVVDIVDLDSNVLELFLRYLYSGKTEITSMDVALELYKAAEKYSVRTLKQLCASYILKNMSKDIVYEVLILADKAGDTEFIDGITSFAVKIEGFLTSAEWKAFAKKFPNTALEVYFKYVS